MSDNWVVQNLENALEVWNDKLSEIWQLITQSPQTFKGGSIWSIICSIHGALQAIGYALLVLFFVVGVVKTCGSFAELKKPEHAVKLFVRFAIAKGLITYGMELMMAILEIIQGVVSTIMNSAGFGSPQATVLPQEIITAVEDCGFFESIPLWAVTLIGGLFIWVLSFVMILSVYGRFFKMYMYTALAPVPLSAFAGEPTQNIGKSFLKSYASVCLEGAIIVLACIIFSVFASSPPVVDPNPRTFDDIMKDLNEQIGLSDLKEIILQKQEQLLYAQKSGKSTYGINPGYYFFVGNPGTGKSTSAKLFGECLRELGIVKTNNFYSCTAKDLIGQYMGETDKKTYELLKKSINGVLFIDEAYSLSYAESAHSDSSYKKEALEQIIAFMDDPEHRKRCCIILAGYEKDMQGLYKSNSGMRSRIEEVHFRDYSPTEMYQIFALFCRKAGYAIADGVEEYYTPIFKNMSTMEYFSNGRTARTIYEKTASNLMRRVVHSDDLTEEEQKTIQMSDLLSEDECYSIVSVE